MKVAPTRRVSIVRGACLALAFGGAPAVVGACSSTDDATSSSSGDGGNEAGDEDIATSDVFGLYTVTNCPNGSAISTPCATCIETACPGELAAINGACAAVLACACPPGASSSSCAPTPGCLATVTTATAQCAPCQLTCGVTSDDGGVDAANPIRPVEAGAEGGVTDAAPESS